MNDKFTEKDFRRELLKLMPSYKWAIHKQMFDGVMTATGIRSSGSNRISTLHVERASNAMPWYSVKSAGHGAKAAWEGRNSDRTLASALRGLQDHYTKNESKFRSLASALEGGRKAEEFPQ